MVDGSGIVAQLALSRPQTDRITAVFDQFLKLQRERWNRFRPLEARLDRLLRQPHPDEGQVVDLITQIEDRRAELNRNRMVMLFHIQQVLELSQRSKLQSLGWSPPSASRRRVPQ